MFNWIKNIQHLALECADTPLNAPYQPGDKVWVNVMPDACDKTEIDVVREPQTVLSCYHVFGSDDDDWWVQLDRPGPVTVDVSIKDIRAV